MADLAPQLVWDDFFAELQEESARACAIVGVAVVDDLLRQLLDRALIADSNARRLLLGDITSFDRPLSSLAARSRAAYCLGLITKSEHDDLALLGKIRNRFAHMPQGYSFSESEIVSWCSSLTTPRQFKQAIGLGSDARQCFELAAVSVATILYSRIAQMPERPRSPKPYDLAHYVRTDGEQ